MNVEHFRIPQPDPNAVLWALALLALAALGAGLLYALAGRRRRRLRRQVSSFDPQQATAELMRLAPGSALVRLRDEPEGDGESERDMGRAPLLKQDGQLLCKGARFLIGPPDSLGKAEEGALRGARLTLEFSRRRVVCRLPVQVLRRKRLPEKVQRAIDVPAAVAYEVVPTGPLEQDELRRVLRYYLSDADAVGVDVCPYVELRLYLARAERPAEAGGSLPALLENVRLSPPTGTYAPRSVEEPEAAIEALHAELRQVGEREVWVARLTEEGAWIAAGRRQVLGLDREEAGQTLKVRRAALGDEDPQMLRIDDQVLVGYAAAEEEREMLCRVIRRRTSFFELQPESMPRSEKGFGAEVLDFSATGVRLQTDPELLNFLLGVEGAVDLEAVRPDLEASLVGLFFYPEFAFPPRAREAEPIVPEKFALLAQPTRIHRLEEEEGLRLGLHFVYEPKSFDRQTGMPSTWRLLRGNRESRVFMKIHRALNRLEGLLQSDSLAGR